MCIIWKECWREGCVYFFVTAKAERYVRNILDYSAWINASVCEHRKKSFRLRLWYVVHKPIKKSYFAVLSRDRFGRDYFDRRYPNAIKHVVHMVKCGFCALFYFIWRSNNSISRRFFFPPLTWLNFVLMGVRVRVMGTKIRAAVWWINNLPLLFDLFWLTSPFLLHCVIKKICAMKKCFCVSAVSVINFQLKRQSRYHVQLSSFWMTGNASYENNCSSIVTSPLRPAYGAPS